MNFKSIVILIAVISLIGFFLWLPEPLESQHDKSQAINDKAVKSQVALMQNVTLFDGETWQEKTDIAFSNGLILDVSSNLKSKYPNAVVIDVSGKIVLPGFIDAHTHAWGDALKQAVQFGVTTELDMFTNNAFAISQRKNRLNNQHNIQQADLFSAGTLVTAPEGHGTEYGFDIPTINNSKEADSFVQSRIDEGSDYIKIVYNATSRWMPSIDKQTLRAVIRAAHSHGKLAVVHISDYDSALDAVEVGANGLVHSFAQDIDMQPLLELMSSNNQFVIATLSVMDSMMAQGDNSQLIKDFENQGIDVSAHKAQLDSRLGKKSNLLASQQARKNIKAFLDAGVLILAGSDAPNPGTAHGISLHGELALLVQSGLTATQAIKTATSNPAIAFKLNDRGFIKAGMKADLLLLNQDPRTDIRHTRQIHSIYKNGFIIQKDNQVSDNSIITEAVKLADFEVDLSSGFATNWVVTSDEMFKGNSRVQLNRVSLASASYVDVSGKIGRQFSFPWAGIYLPFTQSNDQGLDISGMSSIDFKSKGLAGNYKLMLFSKNQPMRPIELFFTVTEQWQAINLDINQVPQGLLKSITGMALVAGSEQNEFELSFDDIWLR